MQVILLATDEQHPLPPLTDELPAPMLPIVDRPVLATTVEILARAGLKQVLVSLHERGGQIASYFGDGRRWGLEIRYLTQRQALGSAGALRFASGLLSESFLVLPGDAVIDLDIDAALSFHRLHGGIATAILSPTPRVGAPMVRVGAEGRILGPGEDAPEAYELAATRGFIFEPGALTYIPRAGLPDLIEDLLPALFAAGERVHGYTMRGYWNPLSSIGAFQEAQEVYLYSAYRQHSTEQVAGGPAEELRFPSLDARQVAPGIWVGRDHSIHPSVKIAAPIFIGAHTWIGREAELGPGTVVGANVVIDEEATISRSTVLDLTYVGKLVHVDERVVTPSTISDTAAGETVRVVDPFLVSYVGAVSAGPGPLSRTLQTLAALGLIAVLSPLMLILALLSLLATGGVLTRLPRVGEHSRDSAALRSFRLLRFRTRRGSEPGRIGRLMERLELNRLLELVNVVRGEMALVGVKPLQEGEAARLKEDWHQRRHERPAGFTGLWYLQTDRDSDFDAVIVADVYYTATRTWRSDVLCLLRTPLAWLRRVRGGLASEGEGEYLVQAG